MFSKAREVALFQVLRCPVPAIQNKYTCVNDAPVIEKFLKYFEYYSRFKTVNVYVSKQEEEGESRKVSLEQPVCLIE